MPASRQVPIVNPGIHVLNWKLPAPCDGRERAAGWVSGRQPRSRGQLTPAP